MEHKPYGPYETYFKRPLDILCALAALIVFGWLYILASSWAARSFSNSPAPAGTRRFSTSINSAP